MTTLEFLLYLARRPKEQEAFARDPLVVARAAGLDRETIEVLATRYPRLLRCLLAEQAGESAARPR